eukprot:CAMPEP_0184478046 /NCGR_PEP_ID=MMETSP0113_2-20130426/159_1 /TAXON_ID=91329 /ORGANISM="Norrisiella sphaerica, Strain BC52" /LENGTH=505 /DNA_ID=CAMNT_0026855685 /DNA_START=109 /DNA_END=1626 /DNA_ORIENTATION=-
MSSLSNGEPEVPDVDDQGEKRGAHEMLELENPAKRQRVEQRHPLDPGQSDHSDPTHQMEHVNAADDPASKEIKMLLQLDAAKKQRPPKPSPATGKQSMRCQVCIRAKKGGCGTERAVYRCLRRPGGPRAASLMFQGDAKADPQMGRQKPSKKERDDGTWLELNSRVHVKCNGNWHSGYLRRIMKQRRLPYGIKLDEDKDLGVLLFSVKNAVIREGSPYPEAYIPGEEEAKKEDESMPMTEDETKRIPQLSATPPLLGITPADMMQQMHPSMSKFHAVVRDAATGGVKLCRKCNQPALPGNYGFCAMHRTPRSRGSGKDGAGGNALGAGNPSLRSVALPPAIAFPGSMPSILQRALQAQAIGGPIATGTASATGSPFAMASMGSIAPPLLPGVPGFFPPPSAEATPVPSSGNGSQEIPIVYGATVGEFLPQGLPGTTATPVVAEAEAEVVATPADSDLKVAAETKAVEMPQTAVASEVVPDSGSQDKNNYNDIYGLFASQGSKSAT